MNDADYINLIYGNYEKPKISTDTNYESLINKLLSENITNTEDIENPIEVDDIEIVGSDEVDENKNIELKNDENKNNNDNNNDNVKDKDNSDYLDVLNDIIGKYEITE